MTLAVIGTAGRGDDAKRLTAAHWRMMTCVAQSVATVLGADHLVSGGAAWADAVAIQLFLDGHAKALTLHLPAEFDAKRLAFREGGDRFDPGRVANHYHRAFKAAAGVDGLADIGRAISQGARVTVNRGGFKARNADVARETDVLLAFTFSGGPEPKDGGTAHTWGLFRETVNVRFADARAHYEESPCGCSNNQPDGWAAYHFDLIQRRLHRHFYEDPVLLVDRAKWTEECEKARESRHATPMTPRIAEEERLDLL